MIRICWEPSILNETIDLPSSKSISNRLLMIRFLSGQHFTINHLSTSDDTQNLALQLENISKALTGTSTILNVGDAGTNMRFLTALLSIIPHKEFILTGSLRMQQRPVKPLVDALQSLGADIQYINHEGFPPLKIKGQALQGGKVKVRADVSSQFISALMLIAPALPLGLDIALEQQPVSYSYINTTAQAMRYFGIEPDLQPQNISISHGVYQSKGEITVESDWSAASYWYGLLALADKGNIKLRHLQKNSWQGDSVIKDWCKDFGIQTRFLDDGALLSKVKTEKLTAFDKDFLLYPDLAQTFAVLLSALQIKAKLTGLSTLKVKETDRITALEKELQQVGVHIQTTNDTIMIHPDSSGIEVKYPIKTYQDHRMAMSMAMLVMVCKEIFIENEQVVSKSYPDFWKDLEKIKGITIR